MRKTIIALVLAVAAGPVLAAGGSASSSVTNVDASSSSGSNANAVSAAQNAGNAQNITFNSGTPDSHQRVDTTPSLSVAPSAFGFSQNNCGGSDSVGIGWTGFIAGGSKSKEMFDCNVRADTIILWQLGLQDAARLRMVCFGSDLTRKAYEAAGGLCPQSSTAKGIEGHAVTQNVAAAAPVAAPSAPMPAAQPSVQPVGQGAAVPAVQSAQPEAQPAVQPVTQAISSPPARGGTEHGRINQDGTVTWN